MQYNTNYTADGKNFLIIAEKQNIYHNLYKGCDKCLLLVKLSKNGKPLQTIYSGACSNDGKIKTIPQSYPFATFKEVNEQATQDKTGDYKWLL